MEGKRGYGRPGGHGMKTHLLKVGRYRGESAHLGKVGKVRMEGKRGYGRPGGHGMKTHLRKVGRYRGETAHLPKEGCVINPLSIRYLIFDAAEVSYFIFVVLQKNLIRLCIIYKTFAAIGIR